MHIHHYLVFGAFLKHFFYPCCPAMRTYLHKSKLYSFYSPFFIYSKQGIGLCIQSLEIAIQPNTNSFFFTVCNNWGQIKIRYSHFCCIGSKRESWAIPFPIEQ